MKTFGFIGCGNMGGALLRAVLKKVPADRVSVCDPDAEKTAPFAKVGVTVLPLADLVANCTCLVLGVKPQGLPALFAEINPLLKARKDRFLFISMAAGTSTEKIASLSESNAPIIRIMPNTPAQVGEGMIVYSPNQQVKKEEIDEFLTAFSEAGRLDKIPESQMDAACALSGCGPAFAFLFADALAEGGVACGLSREQAVLYAGQMLLGSAKLLLESGKTPEDLKKAVCSPGGATIEGVKILENSDFRNTVARAVDAAYRRSKEL